MFEPEINVKPVEFLPIEIGIKQEELIKQRRRNRKF